MRKGIRAVARVKSDGCNCSERAARLFAERSSELLEGVFKAEGAGGGPELQHPGKPHHQRKVALYRLSHTWVPHLDCHLPATPKNV